jgi:hypothetical protein
MGKSVLAVVVRLCVVSAPIALAQGMSVSGVLESYVSVNDSSYGLEEYANIRMQAKIGEKAVFFSAVNLIAASGDYAREMEGNTIIELERLYFKLKGETVNFDGGFMRLLFGYSQVWGSSDFLNPKNPLLPYARPKAILGGALGWYPADSFKFLEFAVAPRDSSGIGGITGYAAEKHWSKASVQMLYSFEFPDTVSKQGFHRAGMSIKADLELGFVVDMLYTYRKNMEAQKDGLSLSAGFDYSLFGGDLIILAEYLYNGAISTTSIAGGGYFLNENYTYSGLTWRFNDYTNAGIALISDIDDRAFISMLSFSYDIFQGANISLSAQMPNENAWKHLNLESRLQLRF